MPDASSGRRRTPFVASSAPRRRSRPVPLVRLAVAFATAALAAAAWLGVPRVEQAIHERVRSAAARRGLAVSVDEVRLRPWPPLLLTGIRVEKPGAWTATIDSAALTLRLGRLGLLRTCLALGPVAVTGPGGLAVDVEPTTWDLAASMPEGFRADLRRPAEGMRIGWVAGEDGARVDAQAMDLPVGELLTARRDGAALLDPGVVEGALHVVSGSGSVTFDVDIRSRGLRVAALSNDNGLAGKGTIFGLPTALAVRAEGSWRAGEGAWRVPRWRVTMDGAAASGAVAVTDVPRAPHVDLSLEVERVDFARLLGTSGLAEPLPVASTLDVGREGDLGSASLSARVNGLLADPRSFTVSQRLDFRPPRRALPALARLRGDFTHEVVLRSGATRAILVSPDSPDFVPLRDVPPLFVRTLLLGEDSNFFGHHGIDLSEVPSALLTNWARGGAVRGASTITQQLAKNLFLSRDKRLGRKLQELSIALLLEATLSKERLLEIYLNVIEWGPDLYGLRPAARLYFGEEPRDLTPKQTAFLVALIPGPVKYQRSFADGSLSPGFRPLVDELLAKLRSVDALDEEAYQAALAEELVIRTRAGDAEAGGGPADEMPAQLVHDSRASTERTEGGPIE